MSELEGREQVERHLRATAGGSAAYRPALRRQAREAGVPVELMLTKCVAATIDRLAIDAALGPLVVTSTKADAAFAEALEAGAGHSQIGDKAELGELLLRLEQTIGHHIVTPRRFQDDALQILGRVQEDALKRFRDCLPVHEMNVKRYYRSTCRERANDWVRNGLTGRLTREPCPLCTAGDQLGCTACGGCGYLSETIAPGSMPGRKHVEPRDPMGDDDPDASSDLMWFDKQPSAYEIPGAEGERRDPGMESLAARALSEVIRTDQFLPLAIALEAVRQISCRTLTVRPTRKGQIKGDPRHSFGGHGPHPTTDRDTPTSDVIDQILQVYDPGFRDLTNAAARKKVDRLSDRADALLSLLGDDRD